MTQLSDRRRLQKPSQRRASWAEVSLKRDGEATPPRLSVPVKLQLRPEPAGGSRSASRTRHAKGQGFHTPRRDTLPPARQPHQPPALPDSSAQPACLGGTAAPRPELPAERQRIPDGGRGVGRGVNKRPFGLTRGTG